VLSPIGPDTDLGQEYSDKEQPEYGEYSENGLDSEADHNLDT
jgi:hypothetical protein